MTRKLLTGSNPPDHPSNTSASTSNATDQTQHQHPPWASLLIHTLSPRLKSHTIPAATGFAFTVHAGSHFRIIDLHGQQVVDFMSWCIPFSLSSPTEHFSASYTRYALRGSAPPQAGEYLISNRDRKMFQVVEDKVKCHDMLFMACNPSFYEKLGKDGHRSCAGNVAEAMNRAGFDGFGHSGDAKHGNERKFEWYDVHDPFNVFQNTPYYSLKALECSRAGDWIEMKAQMKSVVALSSCPYVEGGFNGGKVTDVGIVWEEG